MTLRTIIAALVVAWFVGAVSVAVAGPPKPGAVALEDETERENSGGPVRRVPCDEVIAHIDHDLKPSHVTDPVRVAKQAHTSVLWVERCMEAYGRRVRHEVHTSAEAKELRIEAFEEDEPQEVGTEELGDLDKQDRQEARRQQPHQDQEKSRRAMARPTPEEGGENW